MVTFKQTCFCYTFFLLVSSQPPASQLEPSTTLRELWNQEQNNKSMKFLTLQIKKSKDRRKYFKCLEIRQSQSPTSYLFHFSFMWMQNNDILSWEDERESRKKESKRIRCWGWGAGPPAYSHRLSQRQDETLGIQEEREHRTYSGAAVLGGSCLADGPYAPGP